MTATWNDRPISGRAVMIALLLVGLWLALPAVAQDLPSTGQEQPVLGDAPQAALITVAPADEPGLVTISGASGAVFPLATVAVQNLYTQAIVYATAAGDGSFTAQIAADDDTPFWISPTQTPASALDAMPRTHSGLIVYGPPASDDALHFSGLLSGGAAAWHATASIDERVYAPGDTLSLSLSVRFELPDLALQPSDLRLWAELSLQPISAADGRPLSLAAGAGDGWSSHLNSLGLPVAVDPVTIPIASAEAQSLRYDAGELLARFDFDASLSSDMSAGLYVPLLGGQAAVGDGDRFDWYDNVVFSVSANPDTRPPLNRLPVTIEIGEPAPARLLGLLFSDVQAGGSLGLLAAEDAAHAGLIDGVRFPDPAFVLPPGNYPLDLCLPAMLPGHVSPPLLLLDLPGGEVTVSITAPDGAVQRFDALNWAQMRVTPGRSRLCLMSSEPALASYAFDQYGAYSVTYAGQVADRWGRSYRLDGTYSFWIAERLALLPAVLPGTPLHTGGAVSPELRLLPAVPAEVSVDLHLPSGQSQNWRGQADAYGRFVDDAAQTAQTGAYRLDYLARYTDADGRLWVGALRGYGVIADPEGDWVAVGGGGIAGDPLARQAWFDAAVYPPHDPDPPPRPAYPYFPGDVAFVPDALDGGVQPELALLDAAGQVLPLDTRYALISAQRPDISLRQFAYAGSDVPVPAWTGDERFNAQPGTGADGLRAGDYVFLFGGVVDPSTAAAYGAVAVTGAAEQSARVLPAYSGQPLLTVDGVSVESFFLPTAGVPGQVFRRGDAFSLTGYAAPTLPVTVTLRLTAPSGAAYELASVASPIGFLSPTAPVMLDEAGIWSVQVNTHYSGLTSAGPVAPDLPAGGLPGAPDGRYTVYVVDDAAPPLTTNISDGFALPSGIATTILLDVPLEWQQPRLAYTVRTASYVLDSGELLVSNGRAGYSLDLPALARRFPNLETAGADAASRDLITLSFAASGIGPDGQPQTRVRAYALIGSTLYTVED